MEASKVVGFLGLFLAIIEIWWPGLSVRLERAISRQIEEISELQVHYRKQRDTLAKVAGSAWREVAKGPQLKTPDEAKAEIAASLENMKATFQFYGVSLINFLLLKPFRLVLVGLNKIGRDRAVGGIGIVLAALGIAL